MATIHEIRTVTLSNSSNIHKRILFISGHNPNGYRWKLTQKEAIDGIESGEWNFYVLKGDEKLDVLIAVGPTGEPYLKTEADMPGVYYLLELPQYQSDSVQDTKRVKVKSEHL